MSDKKKRSETQGLRDITIAVDETHMDRVRRLLDGPKKKTEKMGICVFCRTPTVKTKWESEPFTMSTPIGPPLARHQNGAYCTNCGLRYEFKPPARERLPSGRHK